MTSSTSRVTRGILRRSHRWSGCRPTGRPPARRGIRRTGCLAETGKGNGSGRASARRPQSRTSACRPNSLELAGRPRILELLLELLGLVLGGAFLARLRSPLHQVLGLLQAETGDRTDPLDHVDLLLAGRAPA